jgi:4'-phosphopantetheinyl transferase
LSPDELARSSRFRLEKDARRYILCRILLRHLIGQYLDAPASVVVLRYSRRGKPYLANDCDLYFNVSHSDNIAVFAFGRVEVGIDAEQIRSRGDIDSIAPYYLSDGEVHELAALPMIERRKAYLQIWTRKEALLKGLGTGLVDGLRSITVGWPASEAVVTAFPISATSHNWVIRNIGPFRGAVGALAYSGAGTEPIACLEFKHLPEQLNM